ncbi:retrovirus-related pol polyprotein from transposon TNT 1-94 [Tanacetum coccineum]
MVNESSAFLWHKRFGHISKERLQRLVKNKILPNLDFTDFGLCVECIKAKQTKLNKKGATRSDDLLEIIHTDICRPFDTSSFTREKYLITFIDDFSRYGYVYLLHEKSQSINALEVFINEVERQLDRKVKIVRSDREKSKGYRFYCSNHSSTIVKKGNAKFLENGEVSRSVENQVVDINKIRDDDPSPMDVHKSTTTPDVVPVFKNQEQYLNNEQTTHEENNLPTQRVIKSAIPNDYIVYLQETDFEELKSMAQNKVLDLVNLPEGSKRVGYKWVFKTKRDSKGNVKRYKARLVAKGYTQKIGVGYNETFSPISKKDSLRIILALVAHFDLELNQIDVKTTFLNGNLEEEVYIEQPEGFFINGKEKMKSSLIDVCIARSVGASVTPSDGVWMEYVFEGVTS